MDNKEATRQARNYAQQLSAHMDEGGKFHAGNVRDLIDFALDLGNRLERADTTQ